MVEGAVFDRLGRPSFFDGAAEVMGRLEARIEKQNPQATAEACATRPPQEEEVGNGTSKSTSCAFAPQEFAEHGEQVAEGLRRLIQSEAQALAHAIERFVRTGKIELPEGRIEAPAKSTF
jgi:hypothetical protein